MGLNVGITTQIWVAMPTPDHVPERPYHHGDLRRAVVVAALEILSETQSSSFRCVSSPGVLALTTTPLTSISPTSVSCWLLSRRSDSNS